MKLFVDKYKWEGINYQSKIDHWKSFEEKSNNCFQYFFDFKEKGIFSGSKINSNFEKQIILLKVH